MNTKNDKSPEKALKRAASLLSRRMHSMSELRGKLRQKGFSEASTQYAIGELSRLDFLDDAKFAESYAAELSAKGCAARLITNKLMRRGIPKSLAEEESAKFADPGAEIEKATKILASKRKALDREKDPLKRKQKIFSLLRSRGFGMNVISKVIA